MTAIGNVYRQNSNAPRRDELILEHLEYVKHVVGRLIVTLPDGVDKENLEAAGMLGLVEASHQFDEKRGVPFKAFAFRRIQGAIIDELRRNSPLPQKMLKQISDVNTAIASLEPPVTTKDICELTNLTEKEVETCLEAIRLTRTSVLDELKHAVSTVPEDAPEWQAEKGEALKIVSDCIQKLPDQERIVLSMYYLDDLRLKEIGQAMELSESRISRILQNAEVKLQSLVRAKMG